MQRFINWLDKSLSGGVRMPILSASSMKKLSTCHPDIQKVVLRTSDKWPLVVVEGYRSPERQLELHQRGLSKNLVSKHNASPSNAVDVAPLSKKEDGTSYINWNDTERFYALGGYMLAVAGMMGLEFRWGGDWDNDTEVKDQSFNDLVHIERVV